jgi:hypothetical protein
MDLWASFMNKVGVKYDMKPSEYVRRNVRVTPFWHEDLPLMINRYGWKEIYCFNRLSAPGGQPRPDRQVPQASRQARSGVRAGVLHRQRELAAAGCLIGIAVGKALTSPEDDIAWRSFPPKSGIH